MTVANKETTQSKSGSTFSYLAGKLLKDRHFVTALAILLVSAICWSIAISAMKLIFAKYPMPWPETTIVGEDFRLKSLPKKMGHYQMFSTYLGNESISDTVIDDETLGLLKIGNSLDSWRYPKHTSNWYSVRKYTDISLIDEPAIVKKIKAAKGRTSKLNAIYRELESKIKPQSLWSLGIYFYNGGGDTVPHVAGRCQVEAGGVVEAPVFVDLDLRDMDDENWAGKVKFCRVYAEFLKKKTGKISRRVTYYAFCMNGKPEYRWEKVRWNMASYGIRYAYFAKVEFAPMGRSIEKGADLNELDKEAAKFMRAVMPEILKNLPSVEDVKRQEQSGK